MSLGLLRTDAPSLVISTWGNDFTLHANASPMMQRLTREAMRAADGLHADCQRDLLWAQTWGLRKDAVTLVAPGNGGIRKEFVSSAVTAAEMRRSDPK